MAAVLRRVRLAAAAACGLGGALFLASLLITSERPEVIALQAFSPLALPALGASLLLLVLPLGGRADRRTLLVAAVLLAGVVFSIARAVPSWTAGPGSDEGEPLRVMSANARLGLADPGALVELVAAEEPDLLVVQEITPGLLRKLEARGLRDRFPYAVGTPVSGARGTMAFATSPLTGARELGTDHHSWAFDFGGLSVWGAHPAYPYSPRWLGDQQLLADLGERQRPDIALGDFNATIDNPPFRAFVRAAGLADAAEQAGSGWQPTWPVHGFRGIPVPLAAIDHVLVGARLSSVATRTAVIPGTDHKALVADLRVRAASP